MDVNAELRRAAGVTVEPPVPPSHDVINRRLRAAAGFEQEEPAEDAGEGQASAEPPNHGSADGGARPIAPGRSDVNTLLREAVQRSGDTHIHMNDL